MGTKFEYAINPLAASTNSNSFDFDRVDDWDYFQSREVNKFQRTQQDCFRSSMDRMLDKHNIESIKRTMQIQEDIFKHQVNSRSLYLLIIWTLYCKISIHCQDIIFSAVYIQQTHLK